MLELWGMPSTPSLPLLPSISDNVMYKRQKWDWWCSVNPNRRHWDYLILSQFSVSAVRGDKRLHVRRAWNDSKIQEKPLLTTLHVIFWNEENKETEVLTLKTIILCFSSNIQRLAIIDIAVIGDSAINAQRFSFDYMLDIDLKTTFNMPHKLRGLHTRRRRVHEQRVGGRQVKMWPPELARAS